MTKSNFDEADRSSRCLRGRRCPGEGERVKGYGAIREQGWPQRAKDRPDGAIRDGRVAGIQDMDEGAGGEGGKRRPRCSTT